MPKVAEQIMLICTSQHRHTPTHAITTQTRTHACARAHTINVLICTSQHRHAHTAATNRRVAHRTGKTKTQPIERGADSHPCHRAVHTKRDQRVGRFLFSNLPIIGSNYQTEKQKEKKSKKFPSSTRFLFSFAYIHQTNTQAL